MTFVRAVWEHIEFWELAVVAVFTLFCVILRRLDQAGDVSFRFHDLFTSGDWAGKASVSRLGYFGAFLVHSLVVLHQEMKMRYGIDSAMVSLYALTWSGAYVALKAIEMRSPPGPSSTSTTVTNTNTTATTTGAQDGQKPALPNS